MAPDGLELNTTVGLVGGSTIQFAEGRSLGDIGSGLALTEEAFDLIVPCLRAACPEWTDMHRYGVFEVSRGAREALAILLRSEAARLHDLADRSGRATDLFGKLADWLEARSDQKPVSIFGI